jgi:hypothetical protein
MSERPAGSVEWQSGRMRLRAAPGRLLAPHVDAAAQETGSAAEIAPFEDFAAVEAPLSLDVNPPPPVGVLGGRPMPPAVGICEYRAEPDESGIYMLLQTIQSAEGTIYDIALPQADAPDDQAVHFGVPTEAVPLRFPVRQLVQPRRPPTPDEDMPSFGTLGGFESAVAEVAGEVVYKRFIQVLRAPVAANLRNWIAEREGQPTVYLVNPNGMPGQPLQGAEAWRAAFEPGRRYRVLLFVHGFLSNAQGSTPRNWMRNFAPHYDAMLSYSHPTIATGPLQNAADLLQQVPEDLHLEVDIVAHSRGGLVARSLVELLPHTSHFAVQRLLTCGTPHGGTLLGQFHRWDRLASIGLTSTSWLLASTGFAAPIVFVPRLLEYLLRAGGQLFFDLPGVNALDPASDFIARMNEPGKPELVYRVPYAAVIADFEPDNIPHATFRDALSEMLVDAFAGAPNDLVVDTASMSSIDLPLARQLSGWIHKTYTNHYVYFDQPDVQQFAREFFFGG